MTWWRKSIATFALGSFILLGVLAPVLHRIEHAVDYRAHILALEGQTQHVHGDGQTLTLPYVDVEDLEALTCILCQQVEPRVVAMRTDHVPDRKAEQMRIALRTERLLPGFVAAYPVRGPPSSHC